MTSGPALLFMLLAPLPAPARAVAPSFEISLGRVRALALSAVERLRADRLRDLRRELAEAATDARWLELDFGRALYRLEEIQRRLRSPRDPGLGSDLQRLVWDAQDLKAGSRRLAQSIARLEREAPPSPELLEPARELWDNARLMSREAGRFASVAQWAQPDLGRAGWTFEAWQLRNESSEADQAGREADAQALRLLRKLREAPGP